MAVGRAQRIINIIGWLLAGETLTTRSVMAHYELADNVMARDTQRDLKAVLGLELNGAPLIEKHGVRPAAYTMRAENPLAAGEALMVEKILLSARGFDQQALARLLPAVQHLAPVANRAVLAQATQEELRNYQGIASQNAPARARMVWQLQQMVVKGMPIEFMYCDREIAEEAPWQAVKGLPLAVDFDRYYFYLLLEQLPAHTQRQYRLDWMQQLPHPLQAQAGMRGVTPAAIGAHRRQQAFNYLGAPTTITFDYYGLPDYVSDQFATAVILKRDAPRSGAAFSRVQMCMTVEYSAGVRMWLISQSPILRVLTPAFVVADVKAALQQGLARY